MCFILELQDNKHKQAENKHKDSEKAIKSLKGKGKCAEQLVLS